MECFKCTTSEIIVALSLIHLLCLTASLNADDLKSAAPTTGIEAEPIISEPRSFARKLAPGRTRLIAGQFFDETDAHAELAQSQEWQLTPNQDIRLRGNAFAIEDVITGKGTANLKIAPLPDSRTRRSEWDLHISKSGTLKFNESDGYSWLSITYDGGKWGRIEAFQKLQRQIRPYSTKQDGLLLTNTWGDRNRDAQLSIPFILKEIEAAARLGADVVQLDDGWQRGMSANSHKARGGGGAWNGFWDADPNFWEPNPERFPDGLGRLVQAARDAKVGIGLWFAPDSSNNAANWERDAGALLKLYREHGIRFFKIDALKLTTPESEANLRRLFDKVWQESKGEISFDFDVTAERRFGYFDLVKEGRVFLENRYTDFGTYWPHQTLRSLWQLAHWMDPVRLRAEWLNNSRNINKYGENPLAPGKYPLDTLFATTMMGSPLGWFETQHLPRKDLDKTAKLIFTWRAHREKMHSGTIYPVGSAPDGVAWTGFVSTSALENEAYALLFRELNPESSFTLAMPPLNQDWTQAQVLGGSGRATISQGRLAVHVDEPYGFLWIKMTK